MRKKKITFLFATALLSLAGSSLWAQHGVLLPEKQIDLRRGDATTPNKIGYIGQASNVNNEFGAGETSTITNGGITFPDIHDLKQTNPTTLELGSIYSQNIVIDSYNAGGGVYGWLDAKVFVVNPLSGGSSGYPKWDGGTISAYPPGRGSMTLGSIQGIVNGTYSTTDPNTGITTVTVVNSDYPSIKPQFIFSSAESKPTPFTSTRDDQGVAGEDDGVPLVQLAGDTIKSTDTQSAQASILPKTSGNDLIDYKRPTTVAVGGLNNVFDNIFINDIEWWYKTFTAVVNTSAQQSGKLGMCYHVGDPNRPTVASTGGNPPTADNVKGQGYDGSWNESAPQRGTTYLNGAVQILDGASICVKNDIEKKAVNSNAFLVVPTDGNNFALRVGKNFNKMPMYEEATSPTDNAKYTAANFPPAPVDDIYLYPGTHEFSFKGAADLRSYNNGGDIYIDVNRGLNGMNTKSGILGVQGAYNPANAKIHTSGSSNGDDNNEGIIEVGENTTGKKQFNIYSGGVIKNFESRCVTPECFPIIFASSDMPEFSDEGSKPVYILNDGNCCTASIIIEDPAKIADAIGGGGTGGAHIQAVGHVELQSAFSPTTGADKNVHILSDTSYIKTADITYNNAYEGNFVVWAKGIDAGNRSCASNDCGGYLLFNNAVSIEHAKTGITLLRSENDDVIAMQELNYTNSINATDNGEFIVQAGQDINVRGTSTLTHAGDQSILLEAKQSVWFDDKLDFTSSNSNENGNLIVKAGYDNFNSHSANISYGNGDCRYELGRKTICTDKIIGGDIILGGETKSTLAGARDQVVLFRAFADVDINDKFEFTQNTATRTQNNANDFMVNGLEVNDNSRYSADNFTNYVGGAYIYAQTGNVTANAEGDEVKYTLPVSDNTNILIVAAGQECSRECSGDSLHGNIFFEKKLTVENQGDGFTEMWAARDIVSKNTAAEFAFTHTSATDSATVLTAGRHIELNAPTKFTHTGATNNIVMRAGMEDEKRCPGDGCGICNVYPTENEKAMYGVSGNNKGSGNGSIKLYNTLEFTYNGPGEIYMKALAGNIESDPTRWGNAYDGPGTTAATAGETATITFTHTGDGPTRMEANNILLNDFLNYAGGAATGSNGRFSMFAFDSIRTRSISYLTQDSGSVFITTDKMKNLSSLCSNVVKGHIILGSDCKDVFSYDASANTITENSKLLVRAGYAGFKNGVSGIKNLYGGNITFDYSILKMSKGDGKNGGYAEYSTPNGNIWGKDSMTFIGQYGDLYVDAGMGSVEDTINGGYFSASNINTAGKGCNEHNAAISALNTEHIIEPCASKSEPRTGNIMIKGGSIQNAGTGNATYRTRKGFIDFYDKFNVSGMEGDLLKLAHADDAAEALENNWADVSEKDFEYIPAGGSAFYGADNNIMFNYGDGNGTTNYPEAEQDCTYDINYNGYRGTKGANGFNGTPGALSKYQSLFRGGNGQAASGACKTEDNGARDLTMDFTQVQKGGFGAVATNDIDFFTKFTYLGGSGKGMGAVPGFTTLRGEAVSGYGLYLMSQGNGSGHNTPEYRRKSCYGCNEAPPCCGESGYEMSYIAFHDDANIQTEGQKTIIAAPIVEFFGHSVLNAYENKGANTEIMIKTDSLIFHDSAVFDGTNDYLKLQMFGSVQDMRRGVVNDNDYTLYKQFGSQVITMQDRQLPVLELGYQRCDEPVETIQKAQKNPKDEPKVGGDIIVAAKHDFILPIFNTVVANHARISFISDSIDNQTGGEWVDTYLRTDLLRIRNNVEFYTDPTQSANRKGVFKLVSDDQLNTVKETGIYPHHLHLEPAGELSLPGDDALVVGSTTTLGGYGTLHENVLVKANGFLAPGYASLMEPDCTTPCYQGHLKTHNVTMEKDAIFRVSVGNHNPCYDENGEKISGKCECTNVDCLDADTIMLMGKIVTRVIFEGNKAEDERVDDGCYVIATYTDTEGTTKEYVKNFVLERTKLGNQYLSLNFDEIGKVKLCITSMAEPEIERYVDLPVVDGVTFNPIAGKHYINGHDDFTFTASFSGTPLKLTANGYYSGNTYNVDTYGKYNADGSITYTLRQVTEPWIIKVVAGTTSTVGNEVVSGQKVWAYNNTIYINVDKADIASIYSMTGVLYKKVELTEGMNSFIAERGMYVITLSDGQVYKIVVK